MKSFIMEILDCYHLNPADKSRLSLKVKQLDYMMMLYNRKSTPPLRNFSCKKKKKSNLNLAKSVGLATSLQKTRGKKNILNKTTKIQLTNPDRSIL